MEYDNLTDAQRDLLHQIVEQIRAGELGEEFLVTWTKSGGGGEIPNYSGPALNLTRGVLNVFHEEGFIHCTETIKQPTGATAWLPREVNRSCVIRRRAYVMVDSNFGAPDPVFLRYLQPLLNSTRLDQEIKERCLPILATGGTDPKKWDSAVKLLGPILEERLRGIGGVTDPTLIGLGLVNKVLGKEGTLKTKFKVDAEREGHRALFAGAIGAIRNPFGHRFIDPDPETGGKIVLLVDLLLEVLEDLR